MPTSKTGKPESNRYKFLRDGLYFKNFTVEELKKLEEPFDGDLMLEIANTSLYLARLELCYQNLLKRKFPPVP